MEGGKSHSWNGCVWPKNRIFVRCKQFCRTYFFWYKRNKMRKKVTSAKFHSGEHKIAFKVMATINPPILSAHNYATMAAVVASKALSQILWERIVRKAREVFIAIIIVVVIIPYRIITLMYHRSIHRARCFSRTNYYRRTEQKKKHVRKRRTKLINFRNTNILKSRMLCNNSILFPKKREKKKNYNT